MINLVGFHLSAYSTYHSPSPILPTRVQAAPMHISEADRIAIDHTLSYPFDVPNTSFLYVDGRSYPLVSLNTQAPLLSTIDRGDTISASLSLVPPQHRALFHTSHFIPILTSGSNASPTQLARKFAVDTTPFALLFVIKGLAVNTCSVYSAHFASRYCSLPATLVPCDACETALSCILLPSFLLPRLHKTESLGINYGFFSLADVLFQLPDGASLHPLHAYLSLWGALHIDHNPVRLSVFPYVGPHLPAMTEAEVMDAVRRRLGYAGSLDEFILAMLRDDSLRKARIAQLQATFSSFIDTRRFQRLA